jgi:hypothetical protein
MIILDVSSVFKKEYMIWDHAMKTVFAFIGTYAILMFGPMFASSGRRDSATDMFEYLMIDHPEYSISIAFAVALILNLSTLSKNIKKVHLARITYHEGTKEFTFEMTNKYAGKPALKTISAVDLTYTIEKQNVFLMGPQKYIDFREKEIYTVGRINYEREVFKKSRPAIMNALKQINKIKTTVTDQSTDKTIQS